MMGINVSKRDTCRHCGSDHLEQYLSLPPLPMTDSFLASPEDESFVHEINIYLCCDCGLSQTQHDVDAAAYYKDYRFSSAPSGFARDFMDQLAETISGRWGMAAGDTVIEIGSGDGAQLRAFKDRGFEVLGFEPSEYLAEVSRSVDVPVLNQLFEAGSENDIPEAMCPAQVVLLSYTFDHLPEPKQFLEAIVPALDPERGILVIEVHDLEKIFERREFCLFEHEHSVYPTGASMQRMLENSGLCMVAQGLLPDSARRANSLVVAATPKGSRFASQALAPIDPGPCADIQACRDFGLSVEQSIVTLRNTIAGWRREGRKIAGYGAGGRGVMTMAAAASPGDFSFVCDCNTAFHGLYSPGAKVPVVSPSVLIEGACEEKIDDVIIFSFGYIDEIQKDLVKFTNAGGRLINLLDLL